VAADDLEVKPLKIIV